VLCSVRAAHAQLSSCRCASRGCVTRLSASSSPCRRGVSVHDRSFGDRYHLVTSDQISRAGRCGRGAPTLAQPFPRPAHPLPVLKNRSQRTGSQCACVHPKFHNDESPAPAYSFPPTGVPQRRRSIRPTILLKSPAAPSLPAPRLLSRHPNAPAHARQRVVTRRFASRPGRTGQHAVHRALLPEQAHDRNARIGARSACAHHFRQPTCGAGLGGRAATN
jgi:hypothetical protein